MTTTVIFNSVGGSDLASSGAGPSVAISGNDASLHSNAVIDLSSDNPDLSGIATDGSAVLWVRTSSGRQFGRIVDRDDGAKTVTIHAVVDVTESGQPWAIGGKRATFDHSDSRHVWSDMETDWIVETETDQTINSQITINKSAGTVRGSVQDRVSPVTVTQTDNAACFQHDTVTEFRHEWLKLQNSSVGKSGAYGIGYSKSAGNLTVADCVIGDEVNRLQVGIQRTSSACYFNVLRSRVCHCIGNGVNQAGSAGRVIAAQSIFAHNGDRGLIDSGIRGPLIVGCVFANNGTYGYNGNDVEAIVGSVAHSNGIDGFRVSEVGLFNGNVATNNAAYGAFVTGVINCQPSHNAYFGNVSGATNRSGVLDIALSALPYIDADSDNYELVASDLNLSVPIAATTFKPFGILASGTSAVKRSDFNGGFQ